MTGNLGKSTTIILRATITLATAEKLATAFGLTVADLLAVQSSEAFVRALRPDSDN